MNGPDILSRSTSIPNSSIGRAASGIVLLVWQKGSGRIEQINCEVLNHEYNKNCNGLSLGSLATQHPSSLKNRHNDWAM